MTLESFALTLKSRKTPREYPDQLVRGRAVRGNVGGGEGGAREETASMTYSSLLKILSASNLGEVARLRVKGMRYVIFP